MERKLTFRLIQCAVLLWAGVPSAGAQGFPQQPGPGFPGQPGQPPQGLPPGPGGNGFGGGPGPFGQGQAAMPMPMMPMMNPLPAMPEMAKKMVAIMALRQINAAGFTSRDITAALPILKSMREAEKTLEARSNQILDDEKKALLAAQPNAPPPPDSGQRLQEATEGFRQQMDRGWGTIMNAIGPEKAGMLRGLVEGAGMMPGGPTPQGGFGGGAPGPPGAANGQPGVFGNGPVPPAPMPEAPPAEPGADAPQPLLPPTPDGGAPETQSQPAAAQAQGGFGGQGRGQNGFGGRSPQPGQGRPFPGQGPRRFGQPMPGFGMGGPRISLADLIDLLEQKQAAMRH